MFNVMQLKDKISVIERYPVTSGGRKMSAKEMLCGLPILYGRVSSFLKLLAGK
jgi:hypothetical protein